LLRQVLLEGVSLGVAGAALGIGGGYALAAAALHYFGADLGAGFFAGVRPSIVFPPLAALVFFSLGLGVALLGCLAPAIEASRAAPAVALKSGNDEAALSRLARLWPALLCFALAAAMVWAPPVFELPLFGYLAIGLLLVGGIGLMPRLAATAFTLLNGWSMRRTRQTPVLALTLARLANASGQAGIALGGVLASFSLMVAMGIMVFSFRMSLDEWLLRLLPADLYVRVASSGSASLGPAQQQALLALPGTTRIEFLRARELSLDPARPAVTMIARHIDPRDPGKAMVLEGESLPVPAGARGAWVSEAMLDLYGVARGGQLQVPLNGRRHSFFVAGVVRDYVHTNGGIHVRLEDYRALSGDLGVNDVGLWVAPGASADALQARVRALPFGALLSFAKPGEIRDMSMRVFDRSFAVTYLLEAIAIAIGMAGVAATFSAQTLARAREFGMLRHVGVTRSQILRMLAFEGGALSALGVACGLALGIMISLVLVYIVNPQSFHWSMQLHVPWPLIGSVAAALLAASVVTALVSGRYALSGGPIRAVREDW
jgi:putative ABC transport system permease protein